MEQLRAQLGNYLAWMESRGLSGPVAFREPTAASSELEPLASLPKHEQPDVAKAISSEAKPEKAPLIPNHQAKQLSEEREAGKPWKFGFYSSSDLTEEEYLMVSKIALALGLPAEDFKIWAEDSLVHVPVDLLRCTYIVALGPGSGQTLLALGQTVAMNSLQTALQGSPILTIPHPRAMLREPALKAGAWTALQKLKALVP